MKYYNRKCSVKGCVILRFYRNIFLHYFKNSISYCQNLSISSSVVQYQIWLTRTTDAERIVGIGAQIETPGPPDLPVRMEAHYGTPAGRAVVAESTVKLFCAGAGVANKTTVGVYGLHKRVEEFLVATEVQYIVKSWK